MTDIAAMAFPHVPVRVEDPIGPYYQDFSAAVHLVEAGYHGGVDSEGVALTHKGDAVVHDVIVVAQYAIGLADRLTGRTGVEADAVRRRLVIQADWLRGRMETTGDQAGFWLQSFDNVKYPALKAPWVSALGQGQGISALLRASHALDDSTYAAAADAAFGAMLVPVSRGGVLHSSGDDVWLEEYPMEPPLHVLNGAVYALFGVLDYYRATSEPTALDLWERGTATVARALSDFDTGFWSRYDLRTPELASVHYHKNIHLPQLDALSHLTGDPRFSDTAVRWRKYLSSPLSALRRKLEGRSRWQRTARMIGR